MAVTPVKPAGTVVWPYALLAPSDDAAVALQRHCVICARRDSRHTVQAAGTVVWPK